MVYSLRKSRIVRSFCNSVSEKSVGILFASDSDFFRRIPVNFLPFSERERIDSLPSVEDCFATISHFSSSREITREKEGADSRSLLRI